MSNPESTQTEYYEEDSGITFSKIGKFLKKAMPLALIVMLICIMAFTAIYALVLIQNKSKSEYAATQFTLTSKNISVGKNPVGGMYDYQEIANLSNITEAINDAGLDMDIQEAFNHTRVIPVFESSIVKKVKEQDTSSLSGSTLIVDGVAYYATRFQVEFKSGDMAKKVSSEDSKAYLNALVKVYQKGFVQRYSTIAKLSTSFAVTPATHEFIDYVSDAELRLSTVKTFLDVQAKNYSTSRSPLYGKSFADLQSELTVWQNQLKGLNTEIDSKKLAKDPANIISALNAQIAQYTLEVEKYYDPASTDASPKGLIPEKMKQLNDFKIPDIIIGGTGGATNLPTTPLENAAYNALQAELSRLQTEYANYKMLLAKATARKTLFATPNTDPDAIAATDARITAFATQMNAFVEEINKVNADIVTTIDVGAVAQTLAAVDLSENPSVSSILLTYVAVVIISFLIGLLAYPIAKSMRINRKKKVAAVETDVTADAVSANDGNVEQETTEKVQTEKHNK